MQIENRDTRSIRNMLDAYLKAKSLSAADKSLLIAGVNTDIIQEYAAGIGSLSAKYYDQV